MGVFVLIMDELYRYMELVSEYGSLFKNDDSLAIVLDEGRLRDYARMYDCKLGVVFENKYVTFVVDLIESADGSLYTYSRIVNLNSFDGVVIIPVLGDKIVFLNQFRHGTRELELELPRGFSEKSMSARENAEIELFEELGVRAKQIDYIGNIVSDSGLRGGVVHIFKCDISDVGVLGCCEGIKGVTYMGIRDIEESICKNIIRDSFSISALYKWLLSEKSFT